MVNRIAIDIGNSTTACGLFDDETFLYSWYYQRGEDKNVSHTLEQVQHLISKIKSEKATVVALSSVVAFTKEELKFELQEEKIRCIEINHRSQKTISNLYPTLGMDRLANVIAAKKLYLREGDEAAIVIDFGTATTLTAVSKTGRLLGGLITLGLMETLRTIHTLDQLPNTIFEGGFEPDKLTTFATTTEDAIINGTVLAHAALVERWIQDSLKRLSGESIVIATGGLSHLFSNNLPGIDRFDSDLTLKGINLIAVEAEVLEDRV